MKLPKRLDNAITKLYTAFHSGELNAYDCKACAVGNICNNSAVWENVISAYNTKFSDFKSTLEMQKKWVPKSTFYYGLKKIKKTGYSPQELFNVEVVFLQQIRSLSQCKETHFKGLCAVIKYLCELDGIEDVTSLAKLFEYTDNNEPKYQPQ